MAGQPSTPRTKVDVLYQEVLGEVAPLVTRVEAAIAAAEALHAVGRTLPEDLRRVLAEVGPSLARDASRSLGRSARELEAATRTLSDAAAAVTQSARRHAWHTIGLSMAAGFLGGALAGLALGGLLFPMP